MASSRRKTGVLLLLISFPLVYCFYLWKSAEPNNTNRVPFEIVVWELSHIESWSGPAGRRVAYNFYDVLFTTDQGDTIEGRTLTYELEDLNDYIVRYNLAEPSDFAIVLKRDETEKSNKFFAVMLWLFLMFHSTILILSKQ